MIILPNNEVFVESVRMLDLKLVPPPSVTVDDLATAVMLLKQN